MATDIPDTEDAARTWLRTAAPSLGGRVFFGFPAGSPAYPLVTVSQISGTTDLGPAIDYPRLTFQVWGQNKKQASDARRELVTALRSIASTLLDPTTLCYEVVDIFTTWLPDDEAKLARYVVDCTLIVRLAQPA